MRHLKFSSLNKASLVVVTFVITLVIFLLTDVVGGRAVERSGIIVEKLHRPERIHLNKIKGTDQSGEVSSYLTAETEPAEWAIYVKSKTGKVVRMDCEPEIFYSKDIGESIPYTTIAGYITSYPYFNRGLSKLKNTDPTIISSQVNASNY